MSHETRTVLGSCGLMVGLNIAPPPPGPRPESLPGARRGHYLSRLRELREKLLKGVFSSFDSFFCFRYLFFHYFKSCAIKRPHWLAAILEDGYFRQYGHCQAGGRCERRKYTGELHAPRAGSKGQLLVAVDRLPRWRTTTRHIREDLSGCAPISGTGFGHPGFGSARLAASELIVAVSNRRMAGVPRVLWSQLDSPDGQFRLLGTFDPPPRWRRPAWRVSTAQRLCRQGAPFRTWSYVLEC